MKKELQDLLSEAQRQGFQRKDTKKGFQMVPPDPSKPIVTVHKTPSDHRAFRNLVAQFRRSGLVWPPPDKK